MFAAGEIVPGLQAADAVTNGTVEMCHTASYYYWGKDPTFAFGTAVPFGLNCRMQNAWMLSWRRHRPDERVLRQAPRSIGLPAATPARRWAAGSARRSTRLDDLKGLKMRIGGFAGAVIAKLGVVPQQIAGGEIYRRWRRARIDAAEWVGPYDDEKLGFHKVAKYYYYPGWWEGGAMLHAFINLEKWNEPAQELPGDRARCGQPGQRRTCMAKYDAGNPAALKRLVAGGAQLRPFPQVVLEACFKAANEVYAEITGKNEDFKKMYDVHDGVPGRPVSVVPAVREHLRHIHDDPAAQEDAVRLRRAGSNRRPRASSVGLFVGSRVG